MLPCIHPTHFRTCEAFSCGRQMSTSFGWGLSPEVHLWGWQVIRGAGCQWRRKIKKPRTSVLPASCQQCEAVLDIICKCRYTKSCTLDSWPVDDFTIGRIRDSLNSSSATRATRAVVDETPGEYKSTGCFSDIELESVMICMKTAQSRYSIHVVS
jgi:hypothetical protein